MPTVVSEADRNRWLANAEAVGITPTMAKEEIAARAEEVGVDVHWWIAEGVDMLTGKPGHQNLAWADDLRALRLYTETLQSEPIELGICMVVGEILDSRVKE